MNNKEREHYGDHGSEQRLAEVLESGECSQVGDAKAYELGRLLRQSATHQLPESNVALRDILLVELDRSEVGEEKAVKTPLEKTDQRVSRFRVASGLAAGALVAVGAWWLYQPRMGVNLIGGMDIADQLEKANFGNEIPAVDRSESKVMLAPDGELRPASSSEFDKNGKAGSDSFGLAKKESIAPGLAGPGSNVTSGKGMGMGGKFDWKDGSRLSRLAIAPDSESISGEGQALGQKNESSTEDSLMLDFAIKDQQQGQQNGSEKSISVLSMKSGQNPVAVPDGGTVLLGGVKEKRRGVNLVRRGRRGEGLAASNYSDMDYFVEGDSLDVAGTQSNGTVMRFEEEWSEEESEERFRFARRFPDERKSGESYEKIHENRFVNAIGKAAVSTFSIDVDTASYANMRRFLNSGQLPPRDSVRIEELVNYFKYDYPQPKGEDPFSVNMEVASCPWSDGHRLLRVGLKGKEIHVAERPATNVVYLVDVSGSMNSGDKLPLLKRGFQMMTRKLGENDRVTIVTYAGNAGVALEPTNGANTKVINDAIERLTPGGSTHGSAGIELAYKLAQQHFIAGGVNKVILATDGDLNVGVTSDNALVKLIKQKASEGVFLTVLGFGTGNLKDSRLEKLADNGNGHYAYIDSDREAHRVLVQQMSGSLVTIAKDVKIQIEFNPAEVKSYRLIGYENRMLAAKDFDNDKKDAGEIGAGHTVTAIYEIEPAGGADAFVAPQGLKYQAAGEPAVGSTLVKYLNGTKLTEAARSGELATLALRYKKPDENVSKKIEFAVKNEDKSFTSASDDFRFAASVAGFGMILRGSEYSGIATPEMVLQVASEAMGDDATGYRAEFLDLVRKACR